MTPLKVVFALELFWVALVVLQAYIHFFMIAVCKRKPVYLLWFCIRALTAFFFLWVFLYTGAWVHPLILSVDLVIFMMLSHYTIFNPVLNKLLSIYNPAGGYDFWYLGKNSGWLDSFFLKHKVLHRFFYAACFFGTIISAALIIEYYTW